MNETWQKSGPFGTGIERHFDIEAVTAHSYGPTFASVTTSHSSDAALKTAEQRATLITAAPELLQVCHGILNFDDVREYLAAKFPGLVKQIQAAVDKAEGKS